MTQMSDHSPNQTVACKRPTYPEQNEDGVDLSLIRSNLRLSPLERIRKANRLQQSMIRIRAISRRVISQERA